ncbi:short transient receptor potential channel 4-like [Glandiceps talaboti]
MRRGEQGLEEYFLQAVEDGDFEAVQYAIHNKEKFNIYFEDYKGRSALILAIDNENYDILRLLLQQGAKKLKLKAAFMHAVHQGNYEAVEIFCQLALNLRSRGFDLLNSGADCDDHHHDVTPLMKAAQCNDYHIIKLLLDYGAIMPDPNNLGQKIDTSLETSLKKLHIYEALTSEAYISLTSEDPIESAFQLSVKLRQLSYKDYEFGQEYTKLSQKCEQFAADLLTQTRDQVEITSILTHKSKHRFEYDEEKVIHRAIQAVYLKQKKFVANPHCQQYLTRQWYKDLKDKIGRNDVIMGVTSFWIGLAYPIFSILYLFFPKGKLADFMRIPYVKFLMHAMSYLTFLVLLLSTTYKGEYSTSSCISTYTERNDIITCLTRGALDLQQRGPPPSYTEMIIMIWVVGMLWREMKELWNAGLLRYLQDPYNAMDSVQLSLYLCVIALRIVAYLQVNVFLPTPQPQSGIDTPLAKRQTLDSTDFDLIGNQLNEVARLIINNLTTTLGTTDESYDLQNMIADILAGVTTESPSMSSIDTVSSLYDDFWADNSWYDRYEEDLSFAVSRSDWPNWDPTLLSECLYAVANVVSVLRILRIIVLFQFVGPMQISLVNIVWDVLKFLFIFMWVWLAFSLGITQVYWSYNLQDVLTCYQNLNNTATTCDDSPFASVSSSMITLFWSLFDLTSLTDLEVGGGHTSTEGFGSFIYAVFMIISVIILLNVLIAVMSNTYTRIEENADVEWKFYRAELCLSYFDEGTTVPVPFNIIPSPKSIFYIIRHVICLRSCRSTPTRKLSKRQEKNRKKKTYYEALTGRLVHRYFASKGSKRQQTDTNVLTIKELNEFSMNISNQLQNINSQLMDRITALEQLLMQSNTNTNTNIGTSNSITSVAESPHRQQIPRRASTTLEMKMMNAVQRLNSDLHGNLTVSGQEAPPVNNCGVPEDTESLSVYGPYGDRNGIRNPIFQLHSESYF